MTKQELEAENAALRAQVERLERDAAEQRQMRIDERERTSRLIIELMAAMNKHSLG